MTVIRALTTAFTRRRNKKRSNESAAIIGGTSGRTLLSPKLFHAKLIGKAALRPGMLDRELSELMYSMEKYRGKGKKRVSLIFTYTQVVVKDMNSLRLLSQYSLKDVGRLCVDSTKGKTFGFVVRDSKSGLEHFLCFRTTVKGTSRAHNGCMVGIALTQFRSARASLSPPTTCTCTSQSERVPTVDNKPQSSLNTRTQTPPPPPLSKPPTKNEAYDDTEAIYENLTFRESDPIDVALRKAFLVQKYMYHKDMKEKVKFMKKHYQYPIDPDEELNHEGNTVKEWDEGDSEDSKESEWVSSDESDFVETNKGGVQQLEGEGQKDRKPHTGIDERSDEEFEEDRDKKEEDMDGVEDADNEKKECVVHVMKKAAAQRRRALHWDEESEREEEEEEDEEKEEEEEEEEEEDKKEEEEKEEEEEEEEELEINHV